MNEFELAFFLEISLFGLVLVGSGLKSIFQLKAHLEINNRSLMRTSELSFLSLTIVKRNMSSAKSFTLISICWLSH